MYDIKELEEQWKRYNRKKMRPWIVATVLLCALIVAAVIFGQKSLEYLLVSFSDKKETTALKQKLVTDIYLSSPIEQLETKSKEVLIESPMEIGGERMQGGIKEEHPSKKQNSLHIEVIETQTNMNAYKEVEKRFRLGHDPDDSLFLAKAYYLKGMYKEAEYWALQTNKINENIEESWLIFIKAKAKRGHRNEAIRILNTYIGKTNSVEGKILLDKIKKGNI